jgi:hypothetical protein
LTGATFGAIIHYSGSGMVHPLKEGFSWQEGSS